MASSLAAAMEMSSKHLGKRELFMKTLHLAAIEVAMMSLMFTPSPIADAVVIVDNGILWCGMLRSLVTAMRSACMMLVGGSDSEPTYDRML